jgi:hypothetical protein
MDTIGSGIMEAGLEKRTSCVSRWKVEDRRWKVEGGRWKGVS